MMPRNICPAELLHDIQDVLNIIRAWPGIDEVQPGVFHFRNLPFLHFIAEAGRRWATIRQGAHWGMPLALSCVPTEVERKRLLSKLREGYSCTTRARARRAA